MVGAGQLARMTQRAAIDLGVRLEVLALSADDPAVAAGCPFHLGRPDDPAALTALAGSVDVVTLDHELVPRTLLTELRAEGHVIRPRPEALAYAQDKLYARTELARAGFPVPAFAAVAGIEDVHRFAGEHGWPVVLKARSGGYDGRGVHVVGDEGEADRALALPGEWVAEELVSIERELAVVLARRPGGETVVYPVVQTLQRQGICNELVMPAPVEPGLAAEASDLACEVARHVDAVGILAVELFVTADGALLVNELALRPHNSGHATIEASATSQFHNHLRAVLDWPLGDTAMRAPAAAMVNLLGGETEPDLAAGVPAALAVRGLAVHLYGKESRPGRKIGHVTALADDADTALGRARMAAEKLVAA